MKLLKKDVLMAVTGLLLVSDVIAEKTKMAVDGSNSALTLNESSSANMSPQFDQSPCPQSTGYNY